MRKGLTELVFILDRSGSMRGLEADTIGGFNAMIDKQRMEDGEAYISTSETFISTQEKRTDRRRLSSSSPQTAWKMRAVNMTIKKLSKWWRDRRKSTVGSSCSWALTWTLLKLREDSVWMPTEPSLTNVMRRVHS